MERSSNKGGRPTLASLAISEAASSHRQMKLSFNTTTSVEFGLKSPPKLLGRSSLPSVPVPEIIEVVPDKPTPIEKVLIKKWFIYNYV